MKILFAILMGLLITTQSFAGEHEIQFRDRTFTPEPGIQQGLIETINKSKEPIDIIVQFDEMPSWDAIGELKNMTGGLTFLGNATYMVYVQPKFDLLQLHARWIGTFQPEDKINPGVYTQNKNKFTVIFNPWVSKARAIKALRHMVKINNISEYDTEPRAYIITSNKNNLIKIAQDPAVKYIEMGPSDMLPLSK